MKNLTCIPETVKNVKCTPRVNEVNRILFCFDYVCVLGMKSKLLVIVELHLSMESCNVGNFGL